MYKNSFLTSQGAHYTSATKTNQLMLFSEKITVYCYNQTKQVHTLRRNSAEFMLELAVHIATYGL
jgi:hypothetical protein